MNKKITAALTIVMLGALMLTGCASTTTAGDTSAAEAGVAHDAQMQADMDASRPWPTAVAGAVTVANFAHTNGKVKDPQGEYMHTAQSTVTCEGNTVTATESGRTAVVDTARQTITYTDSGDANGQTISGPVKVIVDGPKVNVTGDVTAKWAKADGTFVYHNIIELEVICGL